MATRWQYRIGRRIDGPKPRLSTKSICCGCKGGREMKFQISGTILKRTSKHYHKSREVVFEIEADDRDEARFFFNHGAHLPSVPKGWTAAKLDMRYLAKSK